MKLKKLTICFLIFIAAFSIHAQSKFSFGINSSFLFNTRIITKSGSDIYKDYRNSNEKFSTGFNFEAIVYYKINENFNIETGAGFLKNGYEVKEERLIDPGFSPITAGYYSELYRYSFRNIYLPLHLNYCGTKKLFLNLSFGPSILFPILKNVEWILRKDFGKSGEERISTTADESDINKMNITLNLGIGLGYRLSDKVSIVLIPKVIYNLLGDENSDIRDRLYNISLFNNEDKSTKEHLISYGTTLRLNFGI
jgi:hypothetical protein